MVEDCREHSIEFLSCGVLRFEDPLKASLKFLGSLNDEPLYRNLGEADLDALDPADAQATKPTRGAAPCLHRGLPDRTVQVKVQEFGIDPLLVRPNADDMVLVNAGIDFAPKEGRSSDLI